MVDDRLFLGIDVGSYESKGVITDVNGKVLAYESIPHVINFPHPGWAEQDADKVWWYDFITLSRRLIQKSGIEAKRIKAVGCSGTAQCVLPIDREGRPLMPAILYGIDTRAEKEVTEVEALFGREKILKHCRHRLIAQDLGPRLLWIKKNRPEVYEKMESVLTSTSYLVYRLTGSQVIDIFTAYDSAPMFDVQQYRYLPEMTGDLICLHKLPDPVWSTEIVGTVTAQAANEIGLAEGTPVIAGTSDAGAEALSAGLAEVGDLMIMYGSSTYFILKTDRLLFSQTLWGDSFLEPDTFSVAAGMAVGGSLTRWYRDNFGNEELAREKLTGQNAYAALADLAKLSPPGANGLVMLPYFSGERTPFYDPSARGMLFGLALTHSKADIYRAILESIAYGIRHNVEAMHDAGLNIHRYLAVGGGIRNRLWLQIVSDVMGQEQLVPNQVHGACYGDAFMAAVGIGVFDSVNEISRWVKCDDRIIPNPNNTGIYNSLYPIYRNLYDRTADLMHEIAEIQKKTAASKDG